MLHLFRKWSEVQILSRRMRCWGSTWSVHVPSPTAAAKLRQLLPAFAAHLRSKGWDVQHIRVYVLPQNRKRMGHKKTCHRTSCAAFCEVAGYIRP